jgi:serine/threonine protein phosphatase 1
MIYAIGDIHGCLRQVQELTEEIERQLTPKDTLVFVGDFIDRGPDSKGVIDHVLDLQARIPNVIALRGNHEQMMLDAYDFFNPAEGARRISPELGMNWFANGGDATIKSYGETGSWWQRIPDRHWDFVRSTRMEYVEGGFHFVHAGLVPRDFSWEEEDFDPRLWIREPFIHSDQDFRHVVVFGHTPFKQPLVLSNKIGIDTGAVFGGPLTAVALDPDQPYYPESVLIIQAV